MDVLTYALGKKYTDQKVASIPAGTQVSVSATGTTRNKVNFITINGVEYKLNMIDDIYYHNVHCDGKDEHDKNITSDFIIPTNDLYAQAIGNVTDLRIVLSENGYTFENRLAATGSVTQGEESSSIVSVSVSGNFVNFYDANGEIIGLINDASQVTVTDTVNISSEKQLLQPYTAGMTLEKGVLYYTLEA